jgi:hypothetical protein
MEDLKDYVQELACRIAGLEEKVKVLEKRAELDGEMIAMLKKMTRTDDWVIQPGKPMCWGRPG